MDDFRLRVFITAAKTLNFTKCAEQLFISQPAVSKHIGELESRYKVQLFERSGSRLALTEAGRVMLEHAERMKVCQNSHLLFYAQSPDFHKLGLCYYLKILYL